VGGGLVIDPVAVALVGVWLLSPVAALLVLRVHYRREVERMEPPREPAPAPTVVAEWSPDWEWPVRR
jgi:hypothetical protein